MHDTNIPIKLLDCTLRDGGYYNDWDFSLELIHDYLMSMAALQVDYVEIGFRSLKNEGFKGGCAFSTDSFINSLLVPLELKEKIGVMINGSELILKQSDVEIDNEAQIEYQRQVLVRMFTSKKQSPVTLVRIACHVHELKDCLPATVWLKEHGYLVGLNLMQIADRTVKEITHLAQLASQYPIDTLYFADSMGSLNPEQVSHIIQAFKEGYSGELGIHTHDNMGQAIANSLQAVKEGVTWIDSTVTGMGRGAGNAQTEYLCIALADNRNSKGNYTKLFELVHKYFNPLKTQYGWGENPYYYLAGKYGIHPSYIQEMLTDCSYSEEDILAVIDHLKSEGGKKFSLGTLGSARNFYLGNPRGSWNPADLMKNKHVLIVGTGPSVVNHRLAIEAYIKAHKPFVMALNTQKNLDENLINIRAACHPVKLLADCNEHLKLPQPLVVPSSMLPEEVKQELSKKQLLDFGIAVKFETFEFHENYCILPTSLVMTYALAIATSGQAKRIYLVGFDGYENGDPRNEETDKLFQVYKQSHDALPLISLTPTCYALSKTSIYGLIK